MPVDALADAVHSPPRTRRHENDKRGRRPRSRASPRAGPRASPGSPLPDRSRGGSPSHTGVPIPLSGFPARPAQPPEPILVPKLRIRLADFPYLHCSVWSEADHLGDLLRLSVRRPEQQSDIKLSFTLPNFHWPAGAHQTPRQARRIPGSMGPHHRKNQSPG